MEAGCGPVRGGRPIPRIGFSVGNFLVIGVSAVAFWIAFKATMHLLAKSSIPVVGSASKGLEAVVTAQAA